MTHDTTGPEPTPTRYDPYALLTRKEAADHLRIHLATLTELTVSGALPSVRIGRRVMITRGALEAYIRGEPVDPLAADDRGGLPGGTPSIFRAGADG